MTSTIVPRRGPGRNHAAEESALRAPKMGLRRGVRLDGHSGPRAAGGPQARAPPRGRRGTGAPRAPGIGWPGWPTGRTFALVRHGGTDYNVARRLNGDPAVPVHLTDEGRAQVAALRDRIADMPVDLGVRTRFPRTQQTIEILLEGRDVPVVVCPDLDDVLPRRVRGPVGRRLPPLPRRVRPGRPPARRRGEPPGRPRPLHARLRAAARGRRPRAAGGDPRHPDPLPRERRRRARTRWTGPVHAVANASLMTRRARTTCAAACPRCSERLSAV